MFIMKIWETGRAAESYWYVVSRIGQRSRESKLETTLLRPVRTVHAVSVVSLQEMNESLIFQ